MGKISLSVLPSGRGQFTKYATVITNDPTLSQFQLTIKFETFVPRGYRVGSYLFDPSNEVGGELQPGQNYENHVGIYNDSDCPVEIKKVVTNNPKFTITLNIIEPGKAFNLKIQNHAPLAVGANKLLIKLLTDDPNQSQLEVTVIVNVAGATSAATSEATLPVTKPKPTIPRTRKPKRK